MELEYTAHPMIACIADWEARGITLALPTPDTMRVTPADRLADDDRDALRRWKPSIVAWLAGCDLWLVWAPPDQHLERAWDTPPSEALWERTIDDIRTILPDAWLRAQWWRGQRLYHDVYYPGP